MSSATRAPSRQRIPWCAVALALAGVGLTTRTAEAQATFTVTNTGDSGVGSLRQAILDANASAGTDSIAFAIPGAGLHTIQQLSPLPIITDAVVIDGYTQPGANPNTNPRHSSTNAVLQIELQGGPGLGSGLRINAGPSVVRGLAMHSYDWAIFLGGGHTGTVIEGNFIGTDPTGLVARPNGSGVGVWASGATIGGTTAAARNLISGNTTWGIYIRNNNDDGNFVQGNLIGTDATGAAALGSLHGIGIGLGAATGSNNNVIGGTAPGAGNVIAGHSGGGISINLTHGTLIQGNLFGTDVTGTVALGNDIAVQIQRSTNTMIGGPTAAARNVVAANRFGIALAGGADNNTVQGNYIGTDITGTVAFGNQIGIGDNQGMGVGNAILDNLVSANGTGIYSDGQHVIRGNRIGTDVTGTLPLPNNTGVSLPTSDNVVDDNVIRFNTLRGISVGTAGQHNAISRNAISDNGALGIDLGGNDGVTPNDPLDADTGGNGLQNFPVLTSAVSSTLTTTIDGTLDTAPSGSFTLEFFANAACDPTGYGEGEAYLGSAVVTTDGAGHAGFSVALPVGGVVGFMTATATDASGNTSEFSACLPIVTITPPDPILSTIDIDPTVVSAFGGQADITVTPRDALGDVLDPGLAVTVATTLGTLDPAVVDNLDGTYSQTLTGDGNGGIAVVSASVEGVPLATSAVVTLVPVDPELTTIAVTPSSTFLGGHATITVTPADDLGQSAGAGLSVVIQTTLGTLVGAVQDHGDGTYSQGIDATALGTAGITATVDGLQLDASASLTVADPANLGDVLGLQADGTAFPYGSIQAAVDDVTASSLVKILVAPGVHEEIVHVKKLATPLELEALSALSLVTVRGFDIDKSVDVTIGYFDIDADGKNKHGIAVKGTGASPTSVTVHDCLVHGTKKGHAGVRAKGESMALVLTNCQVTDNGDDGIEVLHEAALTVTACTIERNGDNGVKLEKHAVATISGSTIRDNGLNGDAKKGYGVFRKRDGRGGAPQDVTLVQNVLTGNRGKVVPGSSDEQLGNHDQIIDPTDQQPGY